MKAINKQDLINYLKKSPDNLNFNIFGTMLEDFRNTYETDEQIVNKIRGIITNIIESGGSISPEDDTITELIDLITELLPEKMIIKPVGMLQITTNGEYDVINKAGVSVGVPLPNGTISITQNGITNVNDYEYADVQVPLPSGTIQITQNGTTNVNDYEYANVQIQLPSGTIQITQNGNTNVNDYEYANVNVVDPLGEFVKNNVTNFEIPEGVTSIGNKVFKDYTNLEEVTIPNSVTTLGNEAFSGCTNLATINGGFRIQNTGTDVFYNCPSVLYNGTTGDCKWAQYNGTLVIDGNGNMADYNNNDLMPTWRNSRKIIINNGVTSIGTHAFYGCTSLTSVTIPDSVTSIGISAFSETAWYNNQPNGLIYAGKVAYKYKGTMPANTSITLQEGTKGIAGSAFRSCTGLTGVTIPDSVTNIGSEAFRGCTGLASVTIPDSVTSISTYTFYGCTSLTSVTIPDSVTSIGISAFSETAWYNNQPNGLIYAGKVAYKYKGTMPANTSITLQEGTKGIAGSAFSDRGGLTSITIPDSVTNIGNEAFRACTGLTSITIPDSVTNIGSAAFKNCNSLRSITIPDGVTIIGIETFYGCTYLTSITIPNSVTSIGNHAFYNCNFLTDVYYTGTQEEWNAITIGQINNRLTNATIHYNYTPSN